MKLKNLFSVKGDVADKEISGTCGGEISDEFLLNVKADNDGWADWGKNGTADRGRLSNRLGIRRSSSERPSTRKRSKSEVRKRLSVLQAELGPKALKKLGSKSVGGVFKGKKSDVESKIDSIALARSGSDSNLNPSGLDSLFDKPQPGAVPSKKKLRGGRRRTSLNDSISSGAGDRVSSRRSRSASSRRMRSSSAVSSSSRKVRSTSSKPRARSRSKPRRPKALSESNSTEHSVSTHNTKDSSKKKKKKKSEKEKKKKNKDGSDSSEVSSTPSKVDMDYDGESQGSTNDSIQGKKKKTKDKTRKSKKNKSKPEQIVFPADDFGDGLEGLAEEFKRSKDKYSEEKTEQVVSKFPTEQVLDTKGNNYNEVNNMFEDAWTGMEQSDTKIDRSISFDKGEMLNPFAAENGNNDFAKDSAENDLLRQAVDYEVKVPQTPDHQEEILKLQQQLSTALQKQLTMSEEHIKEKNEFMNVSREYERVKVEVMQSKEERNEIMEELKERDRIHEDDKNRIENLEQAIDKQLGKEEELEKAFQHSEEEIEKLLDEIQNFERKLENGETSGGGVSFVELRTVKIDLKEKEEELVSQKLRIEQLEKELKDSLTVPQLQIEELDQENKALQGRLKGERLEYTSKLSAKDDAISSLRAELENYNASPDAQDLQSARQKLMEAREDATTVRGDLATTKKVIEELRGEREDFLEEFNLLKDNNVFMEKTVKELTEKADSLAKKVLEWTEKTYDWKQRAEDAERKIKEGANDDQEKSGDMGDADPQGMFLQAAMEKGKKADVKGGGWGIFKKGAGKNANENQDLSSEEVRIKVLEEQNQEFEAKISQLSSDIVKMQTGHKEELYSTKKKIAQLEGENDALVVRNLTLGQLQEG